MCFVCRISFAFAPLHMQIGFDYYLGFFFLFVSIIIFIAHVYVAFIHLSSHIETCIYIRYYISNNILSIRMAKIYAPMICKLRSVSQALCVVCITQILFFFFSNKDMCGVCKGFVLRRSLYVHVWLCAIENERKLASIEIFNERDVCLIIINTKGFFKRTRIYP